MNRQLIVAGLVGFGLVLFVFIAGGTAAPQSRPAFDSPGNDSCSTADYLTVPGYITGTLTKSGDVVDYYEVSTQPGEQYQASTIILGSVGDLQTRLRIYNNLCQYTGLQDDSSILWTAGTYTYYVRIEALVSSTPTVQSVAYRLDVDWIEPSPTDTPTHTPTPTPPPSVTEGDEYEVNDLYTEAFTLPVTTYLELGDYLGVANFYPANEKDWYAFWGKDGKWYQITTSELSGVDTYLQIYRQNGTTRITRNDDGGGGYASLASFEADYTGYHYILVTNKATGDATGTYNMTVEEIGEPEPGATHTPGPGPDTKADPCEENADFDHACIIAPNDPKTFNFVPPYGGVDNDFFKLWIKPGYNYECSTSYLDAGVDPNMIVFNGPSWDNALGGNDDVEPGDLNSYFAVYATYEGWLYVLVGYGDRTPSDIYNSNYTLECTMSKPGEPTATPTRPATGTPRATSPSPPTATPYAGLTIRQLTTPTPVSETPLEPGFVRVSLIVYYDANGDGQPGAGEGVAGISAQAYEISTNSLLAQGVTDAQGHLEFTVTAQGPVRVRVPFFGFVQIVAGEEAIIRLRVPSRPLPGGGP